MGVVLLVALAVPLCGQEAGWQVDSATVRFVVRNAGFPVEGSFDGLTAHVCFEPDRLETSSLSGTIDPATIDTGIDMRDRHLQRREWFDVKRFGGIEMRSTQVHRASDGYVGTFLLRIRDVEREVEVPFTFERTAWGARVVGAVTIDRLDYGLGKKSIVLAGEVEIRVELQLAPAAGEGGGDGDGSPC